MKLIQEYLHQVLAQIRMKKIRPILGRELEDHLLLQTQEHQRQGMGQEQAQQQAVIDMGDPVALGKQLDGIHRPMWDIPMLVYALLVVALGLVIQFLLPVWQSTQVPNNLSLPRALIGLGGGLVGFWLASRFRYGALFAQPKKLYLVSSLIVLGMVAVLFPTGELPYAAWSYWPYTLYFGDLTPLFLLSALIWIYSHPCRSRRGLLLRQLYLLPTLIFSMFYCNFGAFLCCAGVAWVLYLRAATKYYTGSRRASLWCIGILVPCLVVVATYWSFLHQPYYEFLYPMLAKSIWWVEESSLYFFEKSGRLLSAVAVDTPVLSLMLFLVLTAFFAYLIWRACRNPGRGGRFLGLCCALYFTVSYFGALVEELRLTHVVIGQYPLMNLDRPLGLVVNGLLLGLLYSTYRNQRLFAESQEKKQIEDASY